MQPLVSDEFIYIFNKIGREFMGGVEVVRIVLDKYKIATGYKISILKNDKSRYTTKCKEVECSWRINLGPVNGDIYRFSMKAANILHRCSVSLRLKSPPVTTNLVKHLISDHIQGDPSLKPN
ncbi:hypothetical protein C5167_026039 [Papaver somniferum]|uniref:uncharacterized protein LOC113344228 n=1 Tax=Papaver somniferum TaxID=3469 RepID=UPI000E6F98A1|nr:uncharacterized protein LOC113344228 [Papaver somniferum]RZC93428.1 hypothetical protein C5167_026039 [Papaver somniferum]